MAGNSIKTLTNSSFNRVSDDLEYLDISHLDLNTFEVSFFLTRSCWKCFFFKIVKQIFFFNSMEHWIL